MGGLQSEILHSAVSPHWVGAWRAVGCLLHVVPTALGHESVDLQSRPSSARVLCDLGQAHPPWASSSLAIYGEALSGCKPSLCPHP